MYKIKVIDENNEFYGQVLSGSCVYYDIKHTGNSDDLYIAEAGDGRKVRLLTYQIDEEHYLRQVFKQMLKELGVKIGDKVLILEGGSGSFSKGWVQEGIHTVTNMDFTGHVTFDEGLAVIFRPKLQVVVNE